MACYRFYRKTCFAFAEKCFLQVHKHTAATFDAKQIEQNKYHPKADRLRHNKIFGFSNNFAGCINERLHTKAVGKIDITELYPTRPKQ